MYYCANSSNMRNLHEQVKKHSVTKNCSDLSLFEYCSSDLELEICFLKVGQNNFGNKMNTIFSLTNMKKRRKLGNLIRI